MWNQYNIFRLDGYLSSSVWLCGMCYQNSLWTCTSFWIQTTEMFSPYMLFYLCLNNGDIAIFRFSILDSYPVHNLIFNQSIMQDSRNMLPDHLRNDLLHIRTQFIDIKKLKLSFELNQVDIRTSFTLLDIQSMHWKSSHFQV